MSSTVQWFDVYNREHLRAYEHLRKEGVWPEEFYRDVVMRRDLPPGWQFDIAQRLANQWVEHRLSRTGISSPCKCPIRHCKDCSWAEPLDPGDEPNYRCSNLASLYAYLPVVEIGHSDEGCPLWTDEKIPEGGTKLCKDCSWSRPLKYKGSRSSPERMCSNPKSGCAWESYNTELYVDTKGCPLWTEEKVPEGARVCKYGARD